MWGGELTCCVGDGHCVCGSLECLRQYVGKASVAIDSSGLKDGRL